MYSCDGRNSALSSGDFHIFVIHFNYSITEFTNFLFPRHFFFSINYLGHKNLLHISASAILSNQIRENVLTNVILQAQNAVLIIKLFSTISFYGDYEFWWWMGYVKAIKASCRILLAENVCKRYKTAALSYK